MLKHSSQILTVSKEVPRMLHPHVLDAASGASGDVMKTANLIFDLAFLIIENDEMKKAHLV